MSMSLPIDISPALSDDLLAYLLHVARPCSPDRRADSTDPGIADLLMDLEADDDLRAKLEIELLSGAGGRSAS